MGRLLALDLGEAIIGCAVSDEEQILATPLPPLLRNEGSLRLRKIRNLLREYAVERILVDTLSPWMAPGASRPARAKLTAKDSKNIFPMWPWNLWMSG